MLARCHLVAGEAVTAEGLFRAALDGLDAIGGEGSGTAAATTTAAAAVTPGFYPSPIHPYSKEATLRGYARLLLQWEKREAEAEQALRRADLVRKGHCFLFFLSLDICCAAGLFLFILYYIHAILPLVPGNFNERVVVRRAWAFFCRGHLVSCSRRS